MKKLILTITSAILPFLAQADSLRFAAHELSVETFIVADAQNITEAPDLGAGVGVSYFITRGFGAGVRVASYDTDGHAVDVLSPRLLVRAPLWDRVAPYGYLEGIRDFERDLWGAGAGGGLEWRIARHFSLFGEAGLKIYTTGYGSLGGAAGIRIPFDWK